MKKRIDEAAALGMLCLQKNEFPTEPAKAVFIKRTTGELRRLNFDFDMNDLIKGTGQLKNFGGKGIVVIRDKKKNQVRSIPIENLLSVTINGRTYRVVR